MKKIEFPYSSEIEENMLYMFESLNEKDRRHYAAIEAQKLGRGGVAYISRLFNISDKTIQSGLDEFEKKVF
jgi:hypothetical protein